MSTLERIFGTLAFFGCAVVGWAAVGDSLPFVEQNLTLFAEGLAVIGLLYVVFFMLNLIAGGRRK